MSITQTSEKIALAISYIDNINAVKSSLKTKFGIADDVPFDQYPDVISPISTDNLVFYKCTSAYHDPYIPAHESINISNMTTPDANGTWGNIRPYYSGYARVWSNGSYSCSFDSTNGYWCIHDSSSSASYNNCYFNAKTLTTSEAGTTSNPWIWDNLGSAGSEITNERAISSFSSYTASVAYVTLKAGTAYKFGIVPNYDASAGYFGHSSCLYRIGSYESFMSSSSDTTADINGHTCNRVMEYTPETDEIIMFGVYVDGTWDVTGGIKFVCYPAPETWVEPSEDPWDYSFTAVNGAGTPTISPVAVAEHPATKTWAGKMAYKQTNDDGIVYYEFADTITENLSWNKFAPNVDEVWSSDATLKLNYIESGLTFPDNASVWTVERAAGATYTLYVDGGEGNIIDWGDGSQTQVARGGREYTHTYADAKKYYVQVIGDTVNNVQAKSAIEAVQCSKSLKSGYRMFYTAGLQKIEDTFQLPIGLENAEGMFYDNNGCYYAPVTLRLPNHCKNFKNFCHMSWLTTDISHWFDDFEIGTHGNTNLIEMFFRCYNLRGTLPVDKLWQDGSWMMKSGDVGNVFYDCTTLKATNDIPEAWY